ncbi:Phosphatidate cytidylyltransferase, mitochondrial [Caenorhabditis elegans]|uniref:Phosphatidate cytidylyltransferase, mitochondrial n=1 Tax=Caenorhabditis elegans TaxID=6239 RepID=A0A078BTI5_CAEEL|nr:Phosphatidate cytidylyltransferase, mitochondrial [Caenorhabditis elegans]CDX47415.1 Phosphatidate cytidylyltransferase, mitochondrial [Caenorhabditis elegans]|eukprot:NP_001293366.1 Phosphatidate cytidylyltransferase, mitochondrial [Caenorhabditis elegans]
MMWLRPLKPQSAESSDQSPCLKPRRTPSRPESPVQSSTVWQR